MSNWRWVLQLITRKLWFRASLLAILGLVTALASAEIEELIPWDLSATIGAGAVEGILEILASSMLVITTFSLSVLVAAHNAATANVTPRAAKLLVQDTSSQNVLAVFIGTFLFSLVGIAALTTGAYGERGRVVLFIVTVGVIGLVITALVRWIDYLSSLGHVSTISDRVEDAARKALKNRASAPTMGARPLRSALGESGDLVPIHPTRTGYVQNIDVARLSRHAEEIGDIFVSVLPGAFVSPVEALLMVRTSRVPDEGENSKAELIDAFAIGTERTFDQDPRFGVAVMAEIASRALSPGINDPGTAIDVVGRMVRLLRVWTPDEEGPPQIDYPKVHIQPIDTDDLFDDAFFPISRDGATVVDVQIRLIKGLATLARAENNAFRDSALKHIRTVLARAEESLTFDDDKARLREAAENLDLPPREH